MGRGRPPEYSVEKADRICAHLAAGRSLRSICKDDDMPSLETVFRWLREKPDFNEQYGRAREAQADAIFDETIDIADDGTNDWVATNDPENPGYRLNGENVQRSRLRIDTRKWMAGKLRPKVYGDKLTQEISGPDGAPIQHEHIAADADAFTSAVAKLASRSGSEGDA